MNADRLLAHYEHISDAPDAIRRLRRFILDLAVRGRLVEQDPKDGHGAELRNLIQADWKRRLDAGEIKRIKKWPETTDEDVPFDVPQNWGLVRLGEAIDLINGRAFKPTDWTESGLQIVRIQNLNDPKAPFNRFDGEVRPKFLIDTGDFLISWSGTPGTSFGAHIWDRGPAVLNQHIFKSDLLGGVFDKHFLKIAINARLLELIEKAHGGAGLQHITKPRLEAVALTLPPLAEQHRIAAKVYEMIALCDRLEAARTEREVTRDRLAAASLARLGAPDPDPAAFQNHVIFALNNLALLVTRPDRMKSLHQTILDLAVRGKLVEQDPADEPAADLLRNLGASSGVVRQTKVEDTGDTPFECPKGWEWTKVQQILNPERRISYGVIKLGAEPKTGGVPTLRCSDVRPGFIELSGVRRVDEAIEAEYARTRLEGGEVVINVRGTLGGVSLVPEELRGFNVAREVAVIPIAADLSGPFLVYLMLSPYFWGHIQNNLRGIAYKGLNLGILRDLPIPLPPLTEQHRIVAKLDELMALCDRLETALTTADATRARLLDALLHEALGPPEGREVAARWSG
ncbi:MAG: restriction endonuclease subunit S [Deltaproteobacteria bacterium]|nr:restriction endonuclease subunit S [Deltaproteobacteria bacterium]